MSDLLDALIVARDTIRVWRGIGLGTAEPRAWKLYQNSPEMRQINAAIANAKESESNVNLRGKQ